MCTYSAYIYPYTYCTPGQEIRMADKSILTRKGSITKYWEKIGYKNCLTSFPNGKFMRSQNHCSILFIPPTH